MGFKDYFDDIETLITESSGLNIMTTLYSDVVDEYLNGDIGPISFWSTKPIDEHDSLYISLSNPLVLKETSTAPTDLYFNIRSVGYAVEHGYDSVIVENDDMSYCILIDFNEEHSDVNSYITEAGKKKGPLSGIRIAKDKRDELIKKRKEQRLADKKATKNKKAHKSLKRNTQTKRPKKAPSQGMRVDVMLANTGKLSPDRVERAMKKVRKQPPKLTGVKDVNGAKYFRAEYNFKSIDSKNRQLGYADVSQDKQYCNELFCSCSDFFYRLYAPYVAAGLADWNIPSKYKSRQMNNVGELPNHKWTVDTNPFGKLFLCKHLWAFLAYYVAGDAGNSELTDDEIDDIIAKYFDDVDGEVDTDSEEDNSTETPFEKAFGKLYVGQRGQDISHYKTKDDVEKRDRKQTFYQLPTDKKDNKQDNEKEE